MHGDVVREAAAARPAQGAQRCLGIDLGATRIKVVVVEISETGDAAIRYAEQFATEGHEGPQAVTARIVQLGQAAISTCGPVAVAGVGVPGLYRTQTGEIEFLPNLPGPWRGLRLQDALASVWQVPVALINDARAFTLAEARIGAAKGYRNVIGITVGTGVGGGIVLDGRLVLGEDGRAGEIGHQIIEIDGPPCTCGGIGCVEALAGSSALTRLAGMSSPAEVYSAARQGHQRARDAVIRVARYLAAGIANIVTLLRPERIVIGGGIADSGDLLLDPVRRIVAERAALVDPATYEIVRAELGPVAGAVGAALWAAEKSAAACYPVELAHGCV